MFSFSGSFPASSITPASFPPPGIWTYVTSPPCIKIPNINTYFIFLLKISGSVTSLILLDHPTSEIE
ncbi:hypothetical protein HanXRQr2_Chr12g0521281 [Helianthus annuus]|uniref:Uncharacterized protein n=1 Tax=Helianthus annuus TaxID=4232 RepID=A0A9K3ENC5_HELAN|nr:hypothetical protein HanXRQr2_Chr12g0521281 [Helianthus annuus]KAJ0861062.1 hypothetical protein HanPSC8_Chr12g0502511 [Helianthus annuus]